MPEITQPLPTQQMTAPSATDATQNIDQQPVSFLLFIINSLTYLSLPHLIVWHIHIK